MPISHIIKPNKQKTANFLLKDKSFYPKVECFCFNLFDILYDFDMEPLVCPTNFCFFELLRRFHPL